MEGDETCYGMSGSNAAPEDLQVTTGLGVADEGSGALRRAGVIVPRLWAGAAAISADGILKVFYGGQTGK